MLFRSLSPSSPGHPAPPPLPIYPAGGDPYDFGPMDDDDIPLTFSPTPSEPHEVERPTVSPSVQPSQDTNLSSVSSLVYNPSQDIADDDQPSPAEFDAEPVESDTEPVTLANPASTAGSLVK